MLNFETPTTLNHKLFDLLNKAIQESDPKDLSMNPNWRETISSAMEIALMLEYNFIYDLLYEVKHLRGTGIALRMNAQALLRVIKHEVKDMMVV